jgi:hypothetical protein
MMKGFFFPRDAMRRVRGFKNDERLVRQDPEDRSGCGNMGE